VVNDTVRLFDSLDKLGDVQRELQYLMGMIMEDNLPAHGKPGHVRYYGEPVTDAAKTRLLQQCQVIADAGNWWRRE